MKYTEDVMKTAREIAADMSPSISTTLLAGRYDDLPLIQSAARAIMAERERCAKVAEDTTKALGQRNAKNQWREQIGQQIAAAIREPTSLQKVHRTSDTIPNDF